MDKGAGSANWRIWNRRPRGLPNVPTTAGRPDFLCRVDEQLIRHPPAPSATGANSGSRAVCLVSRFDGLDELQAVNAVRRVSHNERRTAAVFRSLEQEQMIGAEIEHRDTAGTCSRQVWRSAWA